MPDASSSSKRSLGRWLLGGALALLGLWIAFFDSHSLWRRYQWNQQLDRLTRENQKLRQQIQTLRVKLDAPLADSAVERIAREEYGMKRPGETVYRIRETRDEE
jgi:cell division protein FtsB